MVKVHKEQNFRYISNGLMSNSNVLILYFLQWVSLWTSTSLKKNTFHLAPPIFLYAKVEAGGSWRGLDKLPATWPGILLKVVSVSNGICDHIFLLHHSSYVKVDYSCSVIKSNYNFLYILIGMYLNVFIYFQNDFVKDSEIAILIVSCI